MNKIKVRKNIRSMMLLLIILFSVMSLSVAYGAFQQPLETEQEKPICKLICDGSYDYQVYLRNNSLFDTDVLYPGQGTHFKKIVDHINGSFIYQFSINQSSVIEGTYILCARVQTESWSKTFTIIPTTSFYNDTGYAQIRFDFPINITRFEGVLDQIEREVGVAVQDAKLLINCTISITASVSSKIVRKTYSPSLAVSLDKSIISIQKNDVSSSETITITELIKNDNVPIERMKWTTISLVLLFGTFGVFIGTTCNDKEKSDKQMKKIQKKYGDWIVDIDNEPTVNESKNIHIKEFDGLIKISEEIGKPIFHYTSSANDLHSFIIIDESACYKHVISNNKKQ